MNRLDLLHRAKHDAQRQQDSALALLAVSSILRRDALDKSDDHTIGLTMAELDGLASAVGIIANCMWEDGEQLAGLVAKQLRAGDTARSDLEAALAVTGKPTSQLKGSAQ